MVPESEANEFYSKFSKTVDVPLIVINPDQIWEEWEQIRLFRDREDRH